MTSNTSNGPAKKGSKLWIQILVNLCQGWELKTAILKEANKNAGNPLQDIQWLSPLKADDYREYRLNQAIPKEKELQFPIGIFDFWPKNQPQWDALAWATDAAGKKILLLVEAKAHPQETESSCTAADDSTSEKLIKKSMQAAKDGLPHAGDIPLSVWLNDYYQLGNRLTFLHFLRQAHQQQKIAFGVKLVLINFVNDHTHIPTSITDWEAHNDAMFTKMTGTKNPPPDVLVVNFAVQ